MRVTLFAIGLVLTGFNASFAFEIEDHRIYAAPMPTQTIKVISTADIAAFDPLIRRFQSINQMITVDYTVASSTEVMAAIYDEGAPFDLVISSAMDLQTKLSPGRKLRRLGRNILLRKTVIGQFGLQIHGR